MPWYHGDYPPSYKNQPLKLRGKAVEIANRLLENGAEASPDLIALTSAFEAIHNLLIIHSVILFALFLCSNHNFNE